KRTHIESAFLSREPHRRDERPAYAVQVGPLIDPSCGSSDHDTQRCGIAGIPRNGSDNGFVSMDVRLPRSQRSAGRGPAGGALLLLHLSEFIVGLRTLAKQSTTTLPGRVSRGGSPFWRLQ